MPFDLLALLELDELTPLGLVLNFWFEGLGIGEPLTVEVVVLGGETIFGHDEDEREETMLVTPFGCCKMACEGREILNKVSHGVDGGLPHNYVERDGFHLPSHYFGDGGQVCRDCRHVRAVCAL